VELLNRVKFDSSSDEYIVWKYPNEELRLGSQLIVNQGQEAIFVKGGKALDIFEAGTYTLSTGNLPLINSIINFPFGGKTPFTAEIWYVNRTVKRDMKWGTKGAIQVIDPKYEFPLSIRAFGKWGFKIENSLSFYSQVVGSKSLADSNQIYDYFIGEILQRLSDALAGFIIKENLSFFHLPSRLNDLSDLTKLKISAEFERFGIEVVNFNIERVSIPDDEQKKFQEILGKKMEITQISSANVGQAYVTMRSLDTLEKAAENQSGNAGQLFSAGLGMGAGFGAGIPLGNQVGSSLSIQSTNQKNEEDVIQRLTKLKNLLDSGLISTEDFDKKKQDILMQL
jgi:membrane protease subunit (stomatin/prohibitin family)